jgi:divinyl chlorophyllide a 8-vinyl-reductase
MSKRVLLLGATGTIGRATCAELVARGHEVVCLVRRDHPSLAGATVRIADVTDPASARDGVKGEAFDAVVSCLASRTGAPANAWAIDHDAHVGLLGVAQAAGIPQFVLLSAICVQRPRLAFQHAKLAFEAALIASGLAWSIVRPTAYMKSLSGQVARVAAGKPYLMFGDGTATACKPIADADLAAYLADCLEVPERRNAILPIGGPGPAITPREQGELLFELTGRKPRYRRVPPALLDAIVATLATAGRVAPKLAAKAELARIGRYYATESMLLWDEASGRYDAAATPEWGSETLRGHYERILRGDVADDRGEHAVF